MNYSMGFGDKGKHGKIGIDIEGGQVKPYYQALGERTTAERLKFTAAATDNPSDSDRKRIRELKAELRAQKIRHFLGLD